MVRLGPGDARGEGSGYVRLGARSAEKAAPVIAMRVAGVRLVLIHDDLHVTSTDASLRQWAQGEIDAHQLPAQYTPDLPLYHADRIVALDPDWVIETATDPNADAPEDAVF